MGLLERLGLARKRARPVGQQLEKGRPEGPSARRMATIKAVIVLSLIGLTLLAFPRGDVYESTVQVGDEWRRETLVAPFDFPVNKDPETLEAEREQLRFSIAPYFQPVPGALEQIAANRDTVALQIERTLEAYADYQFNALRGRSEAAQTDSLRYLRLRSDVRPRGLTGEQWNRLTASYTAGVPGLASETRGEAPAPSGRLDTRLLAQAFALSQDLVDGGVLDISKDSIRTDVIRIRNEDENLEQVRSVDELTGINEAYLRAQRYFSDAYRDDSALANLGYTFFRAIFQPSLAYDRGETARDYDRAESGISAVRGLIEQGRVIVREGDIVTEEIKRQLVSLEETQTVRAGRTILWRLTLGQFLLIVATYGLFFLYLYLLRRQIFDENRQVLLVALVFASIVGFFAIAIRTDPAFMLAVPVAIASILLTVMYDSRVGLFATLTLGLLGGHMLGFDLKFAFATIFAGGVGVFSVRDIKNRGQFFLSAGLVFLAYALVLVAAWLVEGAAFDRLKWAMLYAGVNAVLLLLAYPLLWAFERAFDITTDLTLLELSDTNRPLLKELSLRAPGTFNHSLQVANLAEAAADSIGANALLTRVGALYHDIGKMLKPEYFVENQRPGQNPHDHLKPRMSALIIASHVKEGLEMGRQYNLPQRVLQFIPMHHGTTRIEYFYRKALEQRGPEESAVQESEFRYPGPRPGAKESGILMLADSVEAASRSLSEPTHKRLETLIEMIFKARIEDGQIDRTELTFRDLNQIKETFLAMLLGIYHVRVKYPGQAEGKEERAETPPKEPPKKAADGEEPLPPPRPAPPSKQEEGVLGIPEQSVPGRIDGETGGKDTPAAEAPPGPRTEPPRGDGTDVATVPETPANGDSGAPHPPPPPRGPSSPNAAGDAPSEAAPDDAPDDVPDDAPDDAAGDNEELLDLDPGRRAQGGTD